MHDHDQYITLTDAAKITPGRPSTNCMWRWCRRGVRARGGERIKLEHIRVGGKIFTTTQWVEEFGRRLAEADGAYFDQPDHITFAGQPRPRRRVMSKHQQQRAEAYEQAKRELEAAGL